MDRYTAGTAGDGRELLSIRSRHRWIFLVKLPVIMLVLGNAAAAQWGGELRLALHSEPRTLHPLLADEDASETIRYLTGGVLVRLNRVTQKPEPALATTWRVSSQGRVIRFELREGVRFSDGTPFTAEDVVYTIESLLDPKLNSPLADSFQTAGGSPRASAEGPHAVTIQWATPLAGGVQLFDELPILSRQSPLKERATLGPFSIAGRETGAFIRLARNPFYWKLQSGRRLPYLNEVRLEIVQNRDVELLRFRRGGLHLISALDPEQFQDLSEHQPGVAKDVGAALESDFLWFNLSPGAPLPTYEKAWFASRNFRLAISHALRRNDICRMVFHGHASPGIGLFPPANLFWFHRKLQPPAWDLQLSRRLLAADGFRLDHELLRDRDGHPVEFSLVTNAGNKTREQMAAMIQQDLAAVGIRLRIAVLDFPSLLQRIGQSFNYESVLLSFNNVALDPDGQMNVWLSSSPQHCWNPKQPSPATSWEAEIDRLMRAQASTPDLARRKELFDRVQEIVAEEAPIIYLVNKNALVAFSPALANVKPAVLHPRILWNIDEIYLTGGN
jgi:peptide/nickel transport system substrate-binding protein